MEEISVPVKSKLPEWTFWLPFLILAIAKVITVRYFRIDNVAWIYLPYLFSLPMYFWFGPRVYPQHILSEILTAHLVGLGDWVVVIFYGLANASKVFMGYLLYRQMHAKRPLKSKKGFWFFVFWVLVIQNIIGNFLFLSAYIQTGEYGSAMFWRLYIINTLKDVLEASLVCYAVLIFVTPIFRRKGWAREDFVVK